MTYWTKFKLTPGAGMKTENRNRNDVWLHPRSVLTFRGVNDGKITEVQLITGLLYSIEYSEDAFSLWLDYLDQ